MLSALLEQSSISVNFLFLAFFELIEYASWYNQYTLLILLFSLSLIKASSKPLIALGNLISRCLLDHRWWTFILSSTIEIAKYAIFNIKTSFSIAKSHDTRLFV